MNRRDSVLALLAIGTIPLGASAQQAGKVWRVGVLRPAPDDAGFRKNFDPFRQALHELRFTEGANLRFDFRVRPGKPEEILALANELVRAKMDAIFAIAPGGVAAAAKATKTIPIVAVDLESDPIGLGYARSLSRPGGNLTGVFSDAPEMGGKWLQLLRQALPKFSSIAVLWDPAIGPVPLKGVEAAALSTNTQLLKLEARTPADFQDAFQSALKQKSEALLVLGSPVFNSARKEIAELALQHRLPSIMPFPAFADDGGLIAYGPHLSTLYRFAGTMMAKVLNGTPPRDIPIERPTRFELVINLRTARVLGVTIPPSALLSADRVIE